MARTSTFLIVAALTAALSGCSPPPGLDAGRTIPASSEPVVLLPLDQLLTEAAVGGTASDDTAADLVARADALRARAAATP